MSQLRQERVARTRLPRRLRPLFWDYEFACLTWQDDADLVTARILASGDWQAICWLRRMMPAQALREWLRCRHGAGLSPRQLRYWELMLDIPWREVNEWLAD